MADVNINKFRASVVRDGSKPASPGFIVSEGQDPVNPPGTNNYVPYSGATANVELGEYGVEAGFITLDTTPTNTPTDQGTIFWDADDETVDIVLNGYTMKIGEDLFYPVKNQTGSTIAKGVAVRFNGTVGASGRLLIAPFIADGSVPSSRFMGVTAEEILNGEDGKVLYFGRVRGINTNAFNEGDILYASTTVAGGYQTAIPVAPNNIVQVAAVVTKSATVGTIFVRPTLGSNINKDEGVKIVSVADKNLLQYQSGTSLWENKSLAQVLGGTSAQFVKGDGSLDSTSYGTGTVTSVGLSSATSGVTIGSSPVTTSGTITLAIATASGSQNGLLSSTDWTTFNNKQNALTNPVTGTGTTNYLPKFTGSTTIGNSQVFDNSSGVGINTASPLSLLHIQSNSSGQTISNVSNLLLENNGSANDFFVFQTATAGGGKSFSITNAGNVGIKTTTPQGVLDVVGVSYFTRGTKWIVVNPNYGGADTHAQLQASTGMALRFATNGDNDRMTLTSGGNLLVGTNTDTGERLQVSGNIKTNSGYIQIVNATNPSLYINNTAVQWQYYLKSNYNIAFSDAVRDVLTLGYNGSPSFFQGSNVGIGTASPSRRLVVVGGNGNQLELDNTGQTFTQQFWKINGVETGTIWASTSEFHMYTYGSQEINFSTNTAPRMRITSGGNVLIGTTTDNGAKLQVNGNGNFSLAPSLGGYQVQALSNSGSSTSYGGVVVQSVNGKAGYLTCGDNSTTTWYGAQASFVTLGATFGAGIKLRVNADDNTGIIIGTNGIIDLAGPLVVRGTLPADQTDAAVIDHFSNTTRIFSYGAAGVTGDFQFRTAAGGAGSNLVSTINGTTGAYTAVSDINKKKDFEESTIGLNAILGLKPTLYRMKSETNTQKHLGFIAQEVRQYIPNAYVENGEFIGLNEMPIIAALTKAIQELKQEIDTLKN